MPRLAILFEYPSLLGGERSLLTSIERLRQNIEFVAIAPPSGPLAEALGSLNIPVLPSPLFDEAGRKKPRDLAIADLRELLQSESIDHLHGNSLAMGRLAGLLAQNLPIPCTAHLRDIIKLSRRAIDDLNGNAKLLAVSDAARLYHIHQGLDPARVVTLYNGVDIERFRPRPRDDDLRRALNIPQDALVTLTIGQIGLRKGWDTLAKTLVATAPQLPKLYSLLVGERYATKPETIEYEQSVRQILNTTMPGRVQFLGYRDDIPRLLAAADLLIHPARQEPFGRVLLETAAAGRPIIATDVGGTREMLGETAILVPPDDPEAIAAAITTLANDPAQRNHLAQAARKRVEDRFNADKAAKQLAAFLNC